MGTTLVCRCHQCGYHFGADVGSGFSYPKVYSETVKQMKEGKFGNQGKEFFEAFPDGAISCERIVVQCNDCGKLQQVPELALYVPKDGFDIAQTNNNIPWCTAFSGYGYDYVSPLDLERYYQLFEYYDHRCSECGRYTTVVEGFTEYVGKEVDCHVRCPQCGSMMLIEFEGWWD